ncbi:polyketide synthase dehydratase domain-containing protein [Desulfonema limicola]|uniref:polyketide synthase dehydratase domain-containing protein n=1 Tax=Desulfonema limicola TaxID=45656 RepID=UPI001A9B2F02|nr:polyketide synthase dehydratase domain-containing protein [Desulfonema limicola]
MENLSKVNIHREEYTKTLELNIDIQPYFLDHQFENKPVLPAVEAMQILSRAVFPYLENKDINCIANAEFPRFLPIPFNEKTIPVFINIDLHKKGSIKAVLITQTLSKKMKIRRMKEHVSLEFLTCDNNIDKSFQIHPIKEKYFEIPAQRIYKELIPFGPAYHNIHDKLKITENQAEAFVYAGDFASDYSPAGSPFPLDAAFHAACVWGQRYAGIVAFPIGLDKRHIIKPAQPGNTYTARIKPVSQKSSLLIFDIEIYNLQDNLCESTSGVKMKDVSSGRLRPPDWVCM